MFRNTHIDPFYLSVALYINDSNMYWVKIRTQHTFRNVYPVATVTVSTVTVSTVTVSTVTVSTVTVSTVTVYTQFESISQ
jgi:hypothetical protein